MNFIQLTGLDGTPVHLDIEAAPVIAITVVQQVVKDQTPEQALRVNQRAVIQQHQQQSGGTPPLAIAQMNLPQGFDMGGPPPPPTLKLQTSTKVDQAIPGGGGVLSTLVRESTGAVLALASSAPTVLHEMLTAEEVKAGMEKLQRDFPEINRMFPPADIME